MGGKYKLGSLILSRNPGISFSDAELQAHRDAAQRADGLVEWGGMHRASHSFEPVSFENGRQWQRPARKLVRSGRNSHR